MRLSKIKLAGFKSFVDPTTIDLRSNLTGIVGPNGCGKSNTIDAVRWVMGESSAKHLRGSSMEDVIFNGSSARKPVGQASVELIFDNTDASLGGEYAKFAEIAIKRQVTRESASSKYFLNGSKCRRRDITDIFLGTGLGPRSYAIIEQGMISRLIDAKPEELRVYLEEAAGISKYRQRRRETENRIRHTRENLDRLSDLREEIDKHLAQLKRQANAAERYKNHKNTERLLEAELLVLRLQEIRESVELQETKIAQQGILQQEKIANLREAEKSIEEQRSQHTEANEKQNIIQGEFYKIGAEISRIEQTIKHQEEAKARFDQQFSHIEQELETSQKHLAEDQATETFSQREIESNTQLLENLNEELEEKKQLFEEADFALSEWQEKWSALQESIAEPTQQAQIERARMEQLERQVQQNKQRLERLATADQGQKIEHLLTTVETHKTDLLSVETDYSSASDDLENANKTAETLDTEIRELQSTENTLRSEQQSLTGRLASLNALQQAGLGKDKHKTTQWLKQQGLENNRRLAESLQIDNGWEKALETVLSSDIESIEVDKLDSLSASINDLPSGVSLSFVSEDKSGDKSSNDSGSNSLLSKVSNPSPSMVTLLSGIFHADNLQQALSTRNKLANNESIICKEGIWLGRNWLRALSSNSSNSSEEGVLSRKKEITILTRDLDTVNKELEQTIKALETKRASRKALNEQRSNFQNLHNELHRKQSQLENVVNSTLQRIEQTRLQQQQSSTEKDEVLQSIETLEEEHITATQKRNDAVTLVEKLSIEKESLQQQQTEYSEQAKSTRQQMLETQAQQQQLQHQLESLMQALTQAQQHIARATERLQTLSARREQLQEELLQAQTPSEDHADQLEKLLQQRAESEEQLKLARTELQSIDHQIRTLNEQRVSHEHAVETVRNALETMKLTWQESSVRMKTLLEQFSDNDYELETIEKELATDADTQTHQQYLDEIKGKIQRLGAINLAAIDEFEQESERKKYLDKQDEDLNEALDTLETAIAKIDKDTRNLFKDTFDKVNNRIGEMFPRLFGGGKAFLEMTDNDLLTTGVVIMARPPGKRISNIHLMSGGEKALTAAALVFAIFELNPAPFCMLDEVDAPLDEANVRRFAELVKHMSERIQFIFITHNKTTMEVAENLIGVTMRELGVSRTVSVNVSDAAEMSKG